LSEMNQKAFVVNKKFCVANLWINNGTLYKSLNTKSLWDAEMTLFLVVRRVSQDV
jgi:hypothetical protein